MLVTLVVVVTVVAVVGLVAWFFLGQSPARGEGGADQHADTESERFYARADRPAGPDAESMAPYADPRPDRAN
jgi:hypothetical protein